MESCGDLIKGWHATGLGYRGLGSELEVETGFAHDSVFEISCQVEESSRILEAGNAVQVLGTSSKGAQFMDLRRRS